MCNASFKFLHPTCLSSCYLGGVTTEQHSRVHLEIKGQVSHMLSLSESVFLCRRHPGPSPEEPGWAAEDAVWMW